MPKNPSPRQKEASRANGSKGCGAKTEATKKISAQNARKAGLFAKTDALPHEIAEWVETISEKVTPWRAI